MNENSELKKIGKVENNIEISSTRPSKRGVIVMALRKKMEKMKVNQSFLIECLNHADTVSFRNKCHQAAKDANVRIVTRERKKEAHGESGLRVWKVRKPYESRKEFRLNRD